MNLLTATVLDIAGNEVGVREDPPGSNRGARVEEYQAAVPGGEPGDSWCAEFVSWCFLKAYEQTGYPSGMRCSRSALALYNDAPEWAKSDKPSVGAIVVWKHNQWQGHCGLVEGVNGDKLYTIEGNTNVAGSHEGNGVYRHTDRRVSDQNIVGYVDYSRMVPDAQS